MPPPSSARDAFRPGPEQDAHRVSGGTSPGPRLKPDCDPATVRHRDVVLRRGSVRPREQVRKMEQRLSLRPWRRRPPAACIETGLGWAPAAVHEGVTFTSYPARGTRCGDRAPRWLPRPVPAGNGFGGVMIAVNQRSEADVDAALAGGRAAGGTAQAEHTDWGGYWLFLPTSTGNWAKSRWPTAPGSVNPDGTLYDSRAPSAAPPNPPAPLLCQAPLPSHPRPSAVPSRNPARSATRSAVRLAHGRRDCRPRPARDQGLAACVPWPP